MSIPVVGIDPGHGGKDPGASGNGIVEKSWVLDMAKRVGKHLVDGWNCIVKYTRTGDKFIDVTERGRIAERMGVKAFISLHNNAFDKASANGFETFRYSSGKAHDRSLQNAVHDSIMRFLRGHGITDRGKKSKNLGVLRTSNNIPSILIEYLFLTNKKEASLLNQASFKDGLAKATAEGVAAYLKLSKKTPKPDYSDVPPAPNGVRFTRVLERRIPQMEGDDILALQLALGVTPVKRNGKQVGIFGPKTEEAVKKYQKSQGIRDTGRVGPGTWSRLFEKEKEPKPAPKPDKLIRVKVDGKQVGAFSELKNAVGMVEKHVKAGAEVNISTK